MIYSFTIVYDLFLFPCLWLVLLLANLKLFSSQSCGWKSYFLPLISILCSWVSFSYHLFFFWKTPLDRLLGCLFFLLIYIILLCPMGRALEWLNICVPPDTNLDLLQNVNCFRNGWWTFWKRSFHEKWICFWEEFGKQR